MINDDRAVRLIAVTQPLAETGIPDAEALVAYCGRVSAPDRQDLHGTAAGLLAYLIRHQHWSPWEMAHAVVELETTRDIARQILRHRSFSFQEFSQRYAEVVAEPIVREARLQHLTNRQASVATDDELLHALWEASQLRVWEAAQAAYTQALGLGIAKEVARAVLPEGMTPSRLYMAGSLRSWLHYLTLRTGHGTQREHVDVAEQIVAALRPAFPATMAVLDDLRGGKA